MNFLNYKIIKTFGLSFMVALVLFLPVSAAFNKHLIISNSQFVDTSSMSAAQVDDFLDNEGGALLEGWTDNVDMYEVDSRFQVPNDRCLVHKATGMSAAEIIGQAANDWQATYVEWRNDGVVVSKDPEMYDGPVDSCDTIKKYPDINLKTVSPKVILATLEKEQSLIATSGTYSTSVSPYYDPACSVGSSSPYHGSPSCTNNNYKLAWAMGYGVPDSPGKAHRYKGFYNQVMYGAWQMRFNFEKSEGSTSWDGTGSWGYSGPKVGETRNIDGQNINIKNRATASLYYYTPHIHGNENFVELYENWFGNTQTDPFPAIALVGDWDGDGEHTIGLKRGNYYYLDNDNDGQEDVTFGIGKTTDKAIVGDWDGDGVDEIGLRRGAHYYFDVDHDGKAEVSFGIGRSSDGVLVGDWNGDGTDSIGLKRGNRYYLDNNNDNKADIYVGIGRSSDKAIVGDWDGDGVDEIGLRRGAHYYFDVDHDGKAEVSFGIGRSSDGVLVGDWNGDGNYTIGLKRGNYYYFDNDNNNKADIYIGIGKTTDKAIVGDWDGDNLSEFGLWRLNRYYYDTNLDGSANVSFIFGY